MLVPSLFPNLAATVKAPVCMLICFWPLTQRREEAHETGVHQDSHHPKSLDLWYGVEASSVVPVACLSNICGIAFYLDFCLSAFLPPCSKSGLRPRETELQR